MPATVPQPVARRPGRGPVGSAAARAQTRRTPALHRDAPPAGLRPRRPAAAAAAPSPLGSRQPSRPARAGRWSVETVAETRVEMVLPRQLRAAVVAALLVAHPYEEPAYDVFELALPPSQRGLGRVGELPAAELLQAFVNRAATALPATVGGLQALGPADAPVRRVAVCGGSGDSLFAAARAAGANVLLTADLRHHPASEAAEDGGLCLVDAAHWATEWPWLPVAARTLRADLSAGATDTVEVAVSSQVTDPWRLHAPASTGRVPTGQTGSCRHPLT